MYPHINITIALDCVLVWAGARTATLPVWNFCDDQCVAEFIAQLNGIGSQIPSQIRRVEEIYLLDRAQRFRNSTGIIRQRLITRRNDSRVRVSEARPLDGLAIGKLLDMHPGNVELFAGGFLDAANDIVFEVLESKPGWTYHSSLNCSLIGI